MPLWTERTIATVELVIKNLARVLLGLLGGVGVVEVSLVATGDLSLRHDGLLKLFGGLGERFGLLLTR